MFSKNTPFGARLALFVANETLRRHELLFCQPEFFLESHKMEEGELSDSSYKLRTTYSSFGTRDRIQVITWISRGRGLVDRKTELWEVVDKAIGTVTVRIYQGRTLKQTIEESFRVRWDYLSNFFGQFAEGRYLQPYVQFTTEK